MDILPKIGNLITEAQHRDAIHIAVAPVIAGHDMKPGQRIGFISNGDAYTVSTKNTTILGIVDPYLREPVKEGEQFYMFLLPNTITSLRHEWTHPVFEDEDNLASSQETFFRLQGSPQEEKWLNDYAEYLGISYGDLMDGAADYLAFGDYLCRGGQLEGYSTSDEFWEKYQIVTRKKLSSNQTGNFFTCSC